MAASTALTKSDSDSALMPPPPQPKRQKRPAKILEEDVYSDALSHIIARDFFPGLLETEAQQEYLNALDSNNSDRIREAGRKLTQVMTPGPDTRSRRMARGTSFTPRRTIDSGDTPRGFVGDTPARTPAGVSARDFAAEVTPDVDVNMSLGAFQAKYTSEDNESFNELLDKQNASRAAKYAFFHHGNKIPSTNQIAYRSREQRLLESGERSTTSTALTRTNSAHGGQSTVSTVPRPSEDLDERTASVDSFPSRQGPRNHLMFGPEGVEDTHLTYARAAEDRSNAPPKSVTYAATRMQPTSTTSDTAVPSSPSMSAIDAAIAGRPRLSESEVDYSGAETPRVNGYAFVDAEPTPSELGMPVTDEEADAAEREAAMKFMPKAEEGGPNPFNLRERSKREDLHMRLVEKADATRRQERGGGGSQLERLRSLGVTPGRTPTPRFTSGPGKGAKKDSAAAMTPAARRLAGSIATPRRGDGMFAAEKDSRSQEDIWAPTPRPKRGA
ncbi:nuclear protein DGCR14 [Neohortaea acidophila]|uniref:Nuclear protein DGCR14 n=1 Tax=Neohortaea acidophila TaxID=245834 RepID=A0A6A6PFE6_9PEZI|nr:nuclear protein DGCR14 [Neohortaea acidophila]KAF2478675.1 nuclear protein DGCR14 [Neohortaea acidophila]